MSAQLPRSLSQFFPSTIAQWFGVLATAACVLAVAVGIVAASGIIDLRASVPHPDGWAKLLHSVFRRSIAFHAPDVAPRGLNDISNVMIGAAHYANVCANCHGEPEIGQNPIALSLRPEPPRLEPAVKELSDGELFYIVKSGAAYTAMPAWPVSNRDDEVWAMVAFLRQLPDMTYETYHRLALNAEPDEMAASAANNPDIPFGTDAQNFHVESGPPPKHLSPGDAESNLRKVKGTTLPATGMLPSTGDGRPVELCARCHGADGRGREDGAFPNLTLQSEAYIHDMLLAYARGERHSGVMWPVAAELSKNQIDALASYFGGMDAQPSRGEPKASEEMIARGKEIAEKGINYTSGEGMPAESSGPHSVAPCESCHGVKGATDEVVPNIAGQYAKFIANQLRVFRSGDRSDAPRYNPMVGESHDLSNPDIEALSAYYASLEPGQKDTVAHAPTSAGENAENGGQL